MVANTDQAHEHPTTKEVVEELSKIANIGFPILAMNLVTYFKNLILVICLGNLGSLELAGGALAIGFTNISGYSVLSGLAMGMEPLCSQAFGSRNLNLVHVTLQRTIILLLCVSLPVGLLWLNLEPLMLLILHQDPDITRIAAIYCRFAIPDLVANSLLLPLRIYLRCEGTIWPQMWCSLLAIALHVPITIILTFTLCLGVHGIAISTFLYNFNTLFFILAYTLYHRRRQAQGCGHEPLYTPILSPRRDTGGEYMYGFGLFCSSSTQKRKEWRTMLNHAISSCLAVCLEWWWYELMTILAGYLDKPTIALATSAIVIQTTSLMYTLPASLSSSVSTRVGNELGAGRPGNARLATIVAIGLAIITSLFGLLWTIFGREKWGKMFTKDDEILELTMAILPIIGVCELANCPQTTCCGALRGSARPGIGASINFCSFYVVGAPIAILLAFVLKLGFVGLCLGLLAAQIACVVSIIFVMYQTDWEKESSKARELVGAIGDDSNQIIKLYVVDSESY